jgi:hypothetical protein
MPNAASAATNMANQLTCIVEVSMTVLVVMFLRTGGTADADHVPRYLPRRAVFS